MRNFNTLIREIIIKYSKIKVSEEEIYNNTNLFENLGYDSISMIQLVSEIEEKFNIVFDIADLDIELLSTFEKIESLVSSKYKQF